MLKATETLVQRARELMPDLEIEHVDRNLDGGINDILVINRRWVFRFAKEEEYFPLLAREHRLLEWIRPRIDLELPRPVHTCEDCWVYPLLAGESLERALLRRLDTAAHGRIAAQLGAFLDQLHAIDISDPGWEIPVTRAPVTRDIWLKTWPEIRQKIYPLFQRFQVEYVDELFHSILDDPATFDYQPALIHGDLASYHLLFDRQHGRLSGVLDFGMAGIGDPANDFGLLINIYGETFVQKMRPAYPRLDEYLPRARFYAQALELEWLLRGLDSGETFWFTAHIGSARDIF